LTDKEIYRELCEEEPSIPLFSQAWWMDAVCLGMEWNVFLLKENDGSIIASMPFLLKKRWGLKYICQPYLTQTNGIWIKPTEEKNECKRLDFEKKVFDYFIEKIETLKLNFFEQNFHHRITNWLPFHWKGYQQTTRYTYRITDLSDLEKVREHFSDAKKRHIKKAEKTLHVDDSLSPEAFYDFCCMTYKKKNDHNIVPKEIVISCVNAAKKKQKGKVIAIRDAENRIHSVLFVVWDKETAYYLIPATDPDYKTSGASSLIVWEAIKIAKNEANVRVFDFEGSMEENIEKSYRQYGSTQTPYFRIKKIKFWR